MPTVLRSVLAFLLLIVAPEVSAGPALTDLDGAAASVRKHLAAMVELDTTNPPGNEARITEYVGKVLKAEGIEFTETEFAPGRKNLIARLRAGKTSLKPLILLAHTDVVGAENQNWSVPPHRLTEKDGYLYGRGVADDLGMAAVALETMILLKRSGAAVRRDVILALTGDEESSGGGITHQLKTDPASLDGALVFNEGGGIQLGKDGKVNLVTVQMAEKTYVDFKLRVEGPTGHSSVPLQENAIYRLSAALSRLGEHVEAPRLLPITKAYFAARAKVETGPLAQAMKELGSSSGKLPPKALKALLADPIQASRLRTTCVATLLGGGTRVNALPGEATANVNCRVLPDEKVSQVRGRLIKVLADPKITVTGEADGEAGPSPVDGEGPDAIAKVVRGRWPDAVIVPTMSAGATDSRWLRARGIPSYGINPIAMSENDSRRAHGVDERIPLASLKPAVEFFFLLVSEVAGIESR